MITLERLDELLDESSHISFPGCQHSQRDRLLDETMMWIKMAAQLYSASNREPLGDLLPGGILISLRANHFGSILTYNQAKLNLYFSRTAYCTPCREKRPKGQVVEEDCQFCDKHLYLNRKRNAQQRKKGIDGTEEDDRESDANQTDGDETSLGDSRADLLQRSRRVRAKLMTAKRIPTRKSQDVRPYEFQVETPEVQVVEFDPQFDDYDTGPTAEAVLEMHKDVYNAYRTNPMIATWSTVTGRFLDYGYRRTAGGFHQFYLTEPTVEEQLEHIFPIPSKQDLEQWRKNRDAQDVRPEDIALGKLKNSRLPGSVRDADDMERWTLNRMIDPDVGAEAYITGRAPSGKFIFLDIHGSRKPAPDLQYSIDIDSVLWVTDRLKVNGCITLHLLPYTGSKAPISKHNHAYVDLVWPRTEEDVEYGERSSFTKAVPISNLPNTHFAHFGKSEGRAQVFVVFPRMKHKYPLKNVWETKLPHDVDIFWLRHVVYPAMQAVDRDIIHAYTDWDYEDYAYRHKGSREKGLSFGSDQLEVMLVAIQKILDDHKAEPLYARFGSFFFVVQILGIKVPTSLSADWHQLWDQVVVQFPELDWEHMEKTDNGELLVDVGFGIHPPAHSGLLGFWDIEAVELGYKYGGYCAGVTHGVSTVSAIGGIHAEMGTVRKKRTHIGHRLTYNLVYEIMRGKRTRERKSFFSLDSAYNVDRDYLQDIKDISDAFRRNQHKSLGVRDEYRCRLGSVKRLFPLLRSKVSIRCPFSSTCLKPFNRLTGM